MQSTQSLPENYISDETLSLKQDRQALLRVSLASILILPPAGWFFFKLLYWLRPAEVATSLSFKFINLTDFLVFILGILIPYILMILLHEAIHGLFFWLFTHDRPLFAFRIYYAYAAAPQWYIPRNPYLLICLAPLLLISILGVVLMAFVPPTAFLILLFVLLTNASGAAGDLYAAAWLLRKPDTLLANDHGDEITLYVPREEN